MKTNGHSNPEQQQMAKQLANLPSVKTANVPQKRCSLFTFMAFILIEVLKSYDKSVQYVENLLLDLAKEILFPGKKRYLQMLKTVAGSWLVVTIVMRILQSLSPTANRMNSSVLKKEVKSLKMILK